MRSDHVFSFYGDRLTLADSKSPPALEVLMKDGSRAVLRVVIDEPLTPAEQAASIETFDAELDLSSGRLFIATRFNAVDEDDDGEPERIIVKAPKKPYRLTLHSTLAGPNVSGSIDKEKLPKYFRRTRPGEPVPTWVDPPEDSDEFWVGLIAHLLPLDRPAKLPARLKLQKGGQHLRKPAFCPDGLPSHQPDGWKNFVQTDLQYIHDVPRLVSKLTPVPVLPEPVTLPVADLILPYWIAWICGETHPWVGLTCPPTFDPGWPGFRDGIKGTRTKDGWRVDLEGSNARWSQFGHLRTVAKLLAGLPDGSTLELSCADAESKGKQGRHRYIGPVHGGVWSIDHTYPALDSSTLCDMLALVRQAESGPTILARDAAEADRIALAIQTKDFLLRENPPKRSGLSFRLPASHSELMPFLIARAFLARYPKALPAIDRDDDLGEWDQTMDDIAAAGAQFATGEVIHHGTFADFTRTEFDSVPNADHEFARQCDSELQSLGFQLLGDLHSTQTFQAVFRGYALPNSPIYSAVIDSGFGLGAHDFYTRFADGFSLTTAHSDGKQPRLRTQKSKLMYRLEDPSPLADRLVHHRSRVDELSFRHGPPVPTGDLASFAAELDDFFCREHGLDG